MEWLQPQSIFQVMEIVYSISLIRTQNIKIAHIAIVKQIEANIVSEFSKGLTKYGQVD